MRSYSGCELIHTKCLVTYHSLQQYKYWCVSICVRPCQWCKIGNFLPQNSEISGIFYFWKIPDIFKMKIDMNLLKFPPLTIRKFLGNSRKFPHFQNGNFRKFPSFKIGKFPYLGNSRKFPPVPMEISSPNQSFRNFT